MKMNKNELIENIKNNISVKNELIEIYNSNIKFEELKKLNVNELEDYTKKNIITIKNEMYNYLGVNLKLKFEISLINEVYQFIWDEVIESFIEIDEK